MLAAVLKFALFCCAQDPSPLAAEDPAVQLHAQMAERYAAAAALHADFRSTYRGSHGEEQVGSFASFHRWRLAKPLHGVMDGWGLGEEREPGARAPDFSILAGGARLQVVDHEARNWFDGGPGWGFVADNSTLLDPLLWWLNDGAPAYDRLRLEAGADGGSTLVIQRGEITSEIRFDAAGTLRGGRLTRAHDGDDFRYEIEVEVLRLELIDDLADLSAYATSLPEGYEELSDEGVQPDLEEGLLAVGSAAPEVELTGMDDQPFKLSSLRGKTVLLNFWFYH